MYFIVHGHAREVASVSVSVWSVCVEGVGGGREGVRGECIVL